MACGPRRCATCNGSRSNSPRAACMFTGSRTESPVCTQSGVTRCERCASYAAITRETPTYSFPSAAGQSVPSVSTASSSASGRPPRCHFRSTRTCFAMPAGSSSQMMATTRGPCSTTLGTRTFSTPSGTPKWRPTGSRNFWRSCIRTPASRCLRGPCRRRQARDDFRLALNHLRRVVHPDIKHRPDRSDGLLDLLIAHLLDRAGTLDLHFPRHQERANLHVGRRLRLAHLFNRGRPVLFEVGSEHEQEILVERSTRSLQGISESKSPPYRGGAASRIQHRARTPTQWQRFLFTQPPLRCAAPYQSRSRATWQPSRYPHP